MEKTKTMENQETVPGGNELNSETLKVLVPAAYKEELQQIYTNNNDNYESNITATFLEAVENGTDYRNNLYNLVLNASTDEGYEDIPDVILANDDDVVQLVESNPSLFVRFSDYMLANEYQNFKLGNLLQSDESIYGIPFNGCPMALYYNKEFFEGYDFSGGTTWEDLKDIGRSISEERKVPLLPYPDEADVCTMLKARGVYFYDENGEIDANGCLEVIAFFDELNNLGLLASKESYSERINKFINGEIACIIASPYFLNELNSVIEDPTETKWGVMELPKDLGFEYNVSLDSMSWLVKTTFDENRDRRIVGWVQNTIMDNMMPLVRDKKVVPVKGSIIDQLSGEPDELGFEINVLQFLAEIGANTPVVKEGAKSEDFGYLLLEKTEKVLNGATYDEVLDELSREMTEDYYPDRDDGSGSGGGSSWVSGGRFTPYETECYLKITNFPNQVYREGEKFQRGTKFGVDGKLNEKYLEVSFVVHYKNGETEDTETSLDPAEYSVKSTPLQLGEDHVNVVHFRDNVKYIASIPIKVTPDLKQSNKEHNVFGSFPKVNLLTGDVTHESGDISVGAGKNAISISHIYNPEAMRFYSDIDTGMGSGWKLNVQQYIIEKTIGKQSADTKRYYIDAAGYRHEFKDTPISGKIGVYQDVDGQGLILYTRQTFGDKRNCFILKDGGDNYLVFDQSGKMIRLIFAPCDFLNLANERAIAVEYQDDKLLKVYDSGNENVKVAFVYDETSGNITQIAVKQTENGQENILKSVTFAYEAVNAPQTEQDPTDTQAATATIYLLKSRAKGSIAESYTYDENRRSINNEKKAKLLNGVLSQETKSAAKITYEGNSAVAHSVALGYEDSDGFVEKSKNTFVYSDREAAKTTPEATIKEIIQSNGNSSGAGETNTTETGTSETSTTETPDEATQTTIDEQNAKNSLGITTEITNEKGICIVYSFNENGEIVSVFEKQVVTSQPTAAQAAETQPTEPQATPDETTVKTETINYYTLQKESGKVMPIKNNRTGVTYLNAHNEIIESINGVKAVLTDNITGAARGLTKFDLRRGAEVGTRNFIISCYVKLQERVANKLRAIAVYKYDGKYYSSFAPVDNMATNAWQRISIPISFPIDAADDATKISDFTLQIYEKRQQTANSETVGITIGLGNDEGGSSEMFVKLNPITAAYGELLVMPSGTVSTGFVFKDRFYDIQNVSEVMLTDTNDAVTYLKTGDKNKFQITEVKTNGERKTYEFDVDFGDNIITFSDLTETAKSMYRANKNGESGFEFSYNGCKEKFTNVKDVKFIFGKVMFSLMDRQKGYCYFVLNQSSADNGTVTTIKNTLKDEGILCSTTITVGKNTTDNDDVKSSTSSTLTSYAGRKLYEEDAYGVKTTYEYDDFYNLISVTRSKNGKKMLLSKAEYDEKGDYLNNISSGYSSSNYSYKKPFETITEEGERSYNKTDGTYTPTGLKKVVEYDENERVKNIKLVGEQNGENDAITQTVYYKNDITYADGKIRTVSDGNSKYGIKYDIKNDAVMYTIFYGNDEERIHKRSAETNEETKDTITTDTYYRFGGLELESGIDTVTSTTDKYGKLKSLSDGEKTVTYTYTKDIHPDTEGVIYRGNEGVELLKKVNDPYENRTYEYNYDYDGQMCGYEVKEGEKTKYAIRKISETGIKYNFGDKNTCEKYLTQELYDDSVVNQPRIIGTRTYEDSGGNATEDWGTMNLFNSNITYDDIGRVSQKTQSVVKYNYTYFTDKDGNLLPYLKTVDISNANDSVAWNYSYVYDDRGNITEITDSSKASRRLSTKYTYDEANRITNEQILSNSKTIVNRSYVYQSGGKGKLLKIIDNLNSNKTKEFIFDDMGRFRKYEQGENSYMFVRDYYGNGAGIYVNDLIKYRFAWERGNLLKRVTQVTWKNDKKTETPFDYVYNHKCVRTKKVIDGKTTQYYLDGAKILGEDRSDNKKIRYFYDHDGLVGFRLYYGNERNDYEYVKDAQGNIIAILSANGSVVARYRYDCFGKTTVMTAGNIGYSDKDFIGNINPFRWKSFYCDEETGFYYANGRYYDTEIGEYIDAIEADYVEGNAYNFLGLNKSGELLVLMAMLAPYSASIATALKLYTDPTYDSGMGQVTLTKAQKRKRWWQKNWYKVVAAAVSIGAGITLLFAKFTIGALLLLSGLSSGGMLAIDFALGSQFSGALGTAMLGIQTIIIGVKSLFCSPLYGLFAMAVGASCIAFASAEMQEALGYGNWLKDIINNDTVYGAMFIVSNIAAVAVNIVGVKQCFKEGTLVACLDEEGNEIQKPIESIAVGTLVLAYDETTGEKAYKPVVQLFRNETKQWYHIFVNGEEIVCTGGHPFYVANLDKFIPAKELKISDKLLLSNGKTVIIESIEIKTLATPETTYNFEVADFHTYYVTDSNILVHNMCRAEAMKQAKEYLGIEEDAIPDSVDYIQIDRGVRGKPYKAKVYRYGDKWIRDDMGGHRFWDKIAKKWTGHQPSHFNVGVGSIYNGQIHGVHFYYG